MAEVKQLLWVGLGNVGARYERTPHNLGIRALRFWVEQARQRGSVVQSWRALPDIEAVVAEVVLTGTNQTARITCLYPQTNMNRSGEAVAQFLRGRPLPFTQILILHDDLEVPLGEVAVKESGSAAGHNGVRSVQQSLGTTEIPRLRLGIGRPPEGMAPADFVLAPPSASALAAESTQLERAAKVLWEFTGKEIPPLIRGG